MAFSACANRSFLGSKPTSDELLIQEFIQRETTLVDIYFAGINLDEVAQISNQISEALDAKDVLGDKPYTLEVGSPGIDRALTLPRHWRRNNGRLVKINFGSNSEIGRIIESDNEKVSLEVKGKTRSINFDKIDKAFIQVEFNPKKSSK